MAINYNSKPLRIDDSDLEPIKARIAEAIINNAVAAGLDPNSPAVELKIAEDTGQIDAERINDLMNTIAALQQRLEGLLNSQGSHNIERHHDVESVKEILREQLKLAHGGYEKFSGSVGETAVDLGKFERENFDKWLDLAEQAGALKYYANWLNEHPEGKITLGASPNKVIAGEKLEASNNEFGEGQPYPTLAPETNYSEKYSDEELSGPVLPDLDVNFVIFTSEPNLPYGYVEDQDNALKEEQKETPGAHIPSYKDCVAMKWRYREEDALKGVGTYDKTVVRLINLKPSPLGGGWSCVPRPAVRDDGQSVRYWSRVQKVYGFRDEGVGRFVAGPSLGFDTSPNS